MRRNRAVALGASVSIAAAAAAFAGPAFAGSSTHTFTFRTRSSGPAIDKGPMLVQSDADYHAGKLIGRDVISCRFTTVGKCYVTFARKGGIMFGHFTENSSDQLTGKITGGDGTFKGASGSFNNGSGGRHALITLRYR